MVPSRFAYLDQPDFREIYCFGAEAHPKIRFFVEGIRCSRCISKLESIQISNLELDFLEVDLANQTAVAGLKSEKGSFAHLADQILELGFTPNPVLSGHDGVEKFKHEIRKDMIRLAVAGFCAGNIMMLALAVYFGVDGGLKSYFEVLQAALYLPVVGFVALPFYKGFWQGIKARSLSIDGPMAIASLSGFCVSFANLIKGSGSLYFDSLSGFLFLILATRFWQKRVRFEYLKYLRPSVMTEALQARSGTPDSWVWTRADQLQEGQLIFCQAGDWIPADSDLISGTALCDLSILSGESVPRILSAGSLVPAGAKLLSELAEFKVKSSGLETQLGRILASLHGDAQAGSQTAKLSDKASQILLLIVFALAAILLMAPVPDRFERALALIILACPCAMAFGTPLAFAFSMRKAQNLGLILKSSALFEKITQVQTICLDKTGTVTDGKWSLGASSLPLDSALVQNYKRIILGLESTSQHPVAYALRTLWSRDIFYRPGDFSNVAEIPGVGVTGNYLGGAYQFRHFLHYDKKNYGLFQAQDLLWSFELEASIKPGAKELVTALREKGLKLALISGDEAQVTLRAGAELGFRRDEIFFGLTPEEKEKFVRKQAAPMMIGDGLNDSAALRAALVGVAVKGSVDVALHSAEVFLLKDDLLALLPLFGMASLSQNQIHRNLRSALIYNVLGGSAAVLGFINPWIAALLMPISSVFIFVTTWRRLR
jgi:Cu2+-exporting ATPase/Cu+-exporting ATPase